VVKGSHKTQDKPSRQWYRFLVGEEPLGDFWVDLLPSPDLARAIKSNKKKGKIES